MKDFLYRFIGKPTKATSFTILSLLALGAYSAFAQEEAGPTAADAIFTANNIWMLVATFLVFIMHLGFAS
ncbi:MAG: ammonium transporter, partial [Deltaproteobacteria bacterium]|nr:ammonium transporter [Deltaproteobacteria bacterium]